MIQLNPDHVTERIEELGRKVLAGGEISRDEAREIANVDGDARFDLFYWANRIRLKFVGRHVKFCSIVAGKAGACSEDCSYCSQSAKHKTHVKFTKLSVEQMIEAMDQAEANGASSFGIVNSGRGPTAKELEWLAPFYKDAVEKGRIQPCATLGELTEEQVLQLRDMGVQRINHNLETSRDNFPNIVSTHSYEDRLRTIRTAKAAGMQLCVGGIFGLGEGWEGRIDMALELRDIGVDTVPINFLNSIEGTQAHGRYDELTPLESLHIIALYRFLLPRTELKVAGGREKILRDLQSWIFFAGANSFLIGNYLTTIGRTPAQDHQMLADLGVPYRTYDELEHEAAPPMPGERSLALPVVN